ncbi:MAG TPA: Gfo/Idh/MocA family oxidoreductase [Candidatus Angelobacter sp.]|nr:Gfo/Idh/MocA family oxidoreductase [Candidatus Angelobacter sp.]
MTYLRWLVIGVGDITTKRVIPAILEEPRSSLGGIVTRNPQKAVRYGVPAFASLDEALTQGSFDAVYVASPVFLHAPQTIAALSAGQHVLCEKPMALNFAEAEDMVAVAETTKKLMGVAYYRRAYPKVQRAAELLSQGAIGQPVFAFANCHAWFTAEAGQREWLLDPEKAGGGPLYDIGSHRIDLMNYFFGEPSDVRALLSNAVHKTPVEDSATALIRYKNNVHAVVDVRWHSRTARDEFRIVGTNGEIDLSPLNGPQLIFPGGREGLPPHSNLHYPCIENFVNAILSGASLLSTGKTALWTDWITEKALTSGKAGKVVSF